MDKAEWLRSAILRGFAYTFVGGSFVGGGAGPVAVRGIAV